MRNVVIAFLLMFLVQSVSPSYASENENKYGVAVIVGNKNYEFERVPQVTYADRDADAFKRYVIDVLGYRESNVIDLRDATQAEMASAFGVKDNPRGLIWQYLKSNKSDVVVFYSGHGVPGVNDGRGYLLPSNANPMTAELNGYPIDVLYENLASLEARSVTVYLDACFSGDSAGGMLIQSASPVYMEASLPASAAGLTVLTAASGTQLASWDEDRQQGLFTSYVLDGLYGKADGPDYGDGDGSVSLGELKAWLDEEMTYAAQRKYRRIQVATVRGAADLVLASVPSSPDWWVEPGQGGGDAVLIEFEVSDLDEVLYATRLSNVRSGPGTDYGKVGRLDSGAEVDVTGRAGDWYRIALAGGGEGYVLGTLLGGDAPEASATVDTAPTPTVVESEPASEINEDALFWQSIQSSDNPTSFQAYLQAFPSGRYAALARIRLDDLETVDSGNTGNVDVAVGIYPDALAPGTVFQDCGDCPEMVVVPSGSFEMSSPGYEESRDDDEGPVHRVTIPQPFAVGMYEVTRGQFSSFVTDTGWNADGSCWTNENDDWKDRSGRGWRDPGFRQDDAHPVVCVNWNDAKAYIDWLARKTGERYRLLSEAEWEYVARAGTSGPFSFGQISPDKANYDGNYSYNGSRKGVYRERTTPAGSFGANAFGLYDVHGNVWEWVEDCRHDNFNGAPGDGSAWTRGGDCSMRVLRGGSWYEAPGSMRSANRNWFDSGIRSNYNGFRVARIVFTP